MCFSPNEGELLLNVISNILSFTPVSWKYCFHCLLLVQIDDVLRNSFDFLGLHLKQIFRKVVSRKGKIQLMRFPAREKQLQALSANKNVQASTIKYKYLGYVFSSNNHTVLPRARKLQFIHRNFRNPEREILVSFDENLNALVMFLSKHWKISDTIYHKHWMTFKVVEIGIFSCWHTLLFAVWEH